MSSTDQAFIRAYGEPIRAPRIAPPPIPAQTPANDLFEGVVTQPETAWSDVAPVEVTANEPVWTLHSSSIDIGFNSVVPAPHFLRRSAPALVTEPALVAAPAKIPDHAASAKLHESHDRWNEITVNTRTAAVDVAFGSLPKAPLSSYLGSQHNPAHAAPKPMFEIDAVRWPAICQSLFDECGSGFSELADNLRQEAAQGRKVIGVTGLGRSEGRTTLTLCLAKQLAAARIRVAVVDADFESPSVASRLGINTETGWETALTGEQSVWEVMIEATADRLSIVPLAAAHFADQMPRPVYGIAAVLADLAEHYDIVLVDAGPLAAGDAADWLLDPAAGIQSVILSHDARQTNANRLAAACLQLAEAGVRQLGIAETFTMKE
jgi:Mrp family chromosome partitioning ATPase